MSPVADKGRSAGGGAGADSPAPAALGDAGGRDRADDRRWRPLIRSGLFFGRAPRGVRYLAGLVWLLFVIFPVLNAIGKHGTPLEHGLIIGGAALFVATYATLVMR